MLKSQIAGLQRSIVAQNKIVHCDIVGRKRSRANSTKLSKSDVAEVEESGHHKDVPKDKLIRKLSISCALKS